jgi:hypothetical protein
LRSASRKKRWVLPMSGRAEDQPVLRPGHGDELLRELVGGPPAGVEEGDSLGNRGRDQTLPGGERRLEPRLILDQAEIGDVGDHRVDHVAAVLRLEIGDDLVDGEDLVEGRVDDLGWGAAARGSDRLRSEGVEVLVEEGAAEAPLAADLDPGDLTLRGLGEPGFARRA